MDVCAVCWALADSYESITLICQLPPLIQLITIMCSDVRTCCRGRSVTLQHSRLFLLTEVHYSRSSLTLAKAAFLFIGLDAFRFDP